MNTDKVKKISKVIAIIIASLLFSIVLEIYLTILENKLISTQISKQLIQNINLVRFLIIGIITTGISISIYYKAKQIGEYIYKYRYAIAGCIFILCVVFQISGSSIGMWNTYMPANLKDDGVILGISRPIRSDEWATNSPMVFSQEHNLEGRYPYFSNTIRGTQTDTFIVYGQPVFDIAEIFRPFHWGYLLLGSSFGLSFFWIGRMIALFLVTFEMMMLLTKKNKILSLIGAILVTLAPVIGWWFAINGLIEMIVFGQLAILMLHQYMNTQHTLKRLLYASIIALCAGAFILVFYPSWQVPMAYIVLALGIATIITNWRNCKITKKDILLLVVVIMVFALLMGYVLLKSSDTIKSVLNTVYPGDRLETGGNIEIGELVEYPINMFFSIKDTGILTNVCEEATFFGLFPLGIILAIYSMIKNKKIDIYNVLLLVVEVFFMVWCFIGFPEILAKLTLMSNSQAGRAIIFIGLIDILLLIRSVSSIKEPIKINISAIGAIILGTIVSICCYYSFKSFFENKLILAIIWIVLCTMFYLFSRVQKEKVAKVLLIVIFIIMLFTSGFINPVRIGTDVIYKNEIAQAISKINKENPGLWIVEELGYPNINYAIMQGAATINSTNVYPNLERWQKFDITGEYEEIYNRYAHICVHLVDEILEDRFTLLQPDSFEVNLTIEEIKELGVRYIFTNRELYMYETEDIELRNLYEGYGMKIYEIGEK